MDRGKIGKKEGRVTLGCLFFLLLAFYFVLSLGNILALFLYVEFVVVLVLTFVPLFVKYKRQFIKFFQVLLFQAEWNQNGSSFLEITQTGSKYSFRSGIAAFITGFVLCLIAFDAQRSEVGGWMACVVLGVFPSLALSKLIFPYFGKKCLKRTSPSNVMNPSKKKVVLTLYFLLIALFLLIVIISHWDSGTFQNDRVKQNVMNKHMFSHAERTP